MDLLEALDLRRDGLHILLQKLDPELQAVHVALHPRDAPGKKEEEEREKQRVVVKCLAEATYLKYSVSFF